MQLRFKILIFLSFLIPNSLQQRGKVFDFSDCSGFTNPAISIEKIELDPQVPRSMENCKISGTITSKSDEPIRLAFAKSNLKYMGLTIAKFTDSIEIILYPGESISDWKYLPTKYGPAGKYDIRVEMYDQSARMVVCYNACFILSKPAPTSE